MITYSDIIEVQTDEAETNVTIAQIRNHLIRRQFPCLLSEEAYTEIVKEALRQLAAYKTVTKFATFQTTIDVQDYFLWEDSTLPATTISVDQVYWNPSGDSVDSDILSPTWLLLSDLITNGAYFNQASQMVILQQKLGQWRRFFGNQGFTVYGEAGDDEAYLRLYPVPRQEGITVIVEYTTAYDLSTLPTLSSNKRIIRYFLQWVEAEAAEALARYYSQTAGVELMGFKTPADALKFWAERATMLRKRATDTQGGIQGEADRT